MNTPVRPHTWQLDRQGNVDALAVNYEDSDGQGHNGPLCTVCDWSFCEHCFPEEWHSECDGPSEAGSNA